MKKIKSPWYALAWIVIWTAALVWFFRSGLFTTRELLGIAAVYVILVGVTVTLLAIYFLRLKQAREAAAKVTTKAPTLNSPCPCGSGKKYKRCCGAPAPSRD